MLKSKLLRRAILPVAAAMIQFYLAPDMELVETRPETRPAAVEATVEPKPRPSRRPARTTVASSPSMESLVQIETREGQETDNADNR